ncbi:nuclear transport factor 2 family protein [Streptomyces sp. NPDC091292]|uniref:nuclear transport factor 2 family protein n=1 Tax=Streptomyces sp. NPDC091292 TaxID=3365991 RepID=UPI0037FC5430
MQGEAVQEQEAAAQSAIDTFILAFNASADSYVTELLSQALTSDVVFWGPLGRSVSVESVERFVLELRRHPAGPGTLERCSTVDAPGEWARYRWVYRTPDDGPTLAGTDVVHLRDDRIDQMIVFAGDVPATAPGGLTR